MTSGLPKPSEGFVLSYDKESRTGIMVNSEGAHRWRFRLDGGRRMTPAGRLDPSIGGYAAGRLLREPKPFDAVWVCIEKIDGELVVKYWSFRNPPEGAELPRNLAAMSVS